MKYKFVGEGMGVPGLPYEVTREEAQRLEVEAILDAAIANGNYVEAPDEKTSAVLEETDNGQ